METGETGTAAEEGIVIALRTLWRYTKDSYPYQTRCPGCDVCKGEKHFLNDSELETVLPGERCDWARGGVYEQLGWAVPV